VGKGLREAGVRAVTLIGCFHSPHHPNVHRTASYSGYVYLSHAFEEVSALVSPEVASNLDSTQSYGVWWYGMERHFYAQRREAGMGA